MSVVKEQTNNDENNNLYMDYETLQNQIKKLSNISFQVWFNENKELCENIRMKINNFCCDVGLD